jgi:hypothetical protein
MSCWQVLSEMPDAPATVLRGMEVGELLRLDHRIGHGFHVMVGWLSPSNSSGSQR